MAVTLQAQFDWYYAALSLSKARPPPLKKRLQEHMLNCDPSIYVHHVALLSSGSFLLSSEHLSLLKRSDCKAEGFSCLRAVPVEVLSSSDQSPVSLCGSSNTPAKQTGSVRPAFSLLLSFSVDQRECSQAGLSLPLCSLSP